MRANAGSCRAAFAISAWRMKTLPARFRRSAAPFQDGPLLPEYGAAGDDGAVFGPGFPVCARYPQENTIFGDKVWVSTYILCISTFRVLTDGGKAYYI